MATFKDFEGRPLGILCHDSLVITGLAQTLDPETGNLTLRQATTFLHGSVIRKPMVVINRDSVVDACVLPSIESIYSMPDMRYFPSFKANCTDPSPEARTYPPERPRAASPPPKWAEQFRRPPPNPPGASAIETLEDGFEKIRLQADGDGSDFAYSDTRIARGEKYQHPQALFEELPVQRQYRRPRPVDRRPRESAPGPPKRQPTSSSHKAAAARGASPSEYPEPKPAQSRRNKARNRYLATGDSDLNDSDYPSFNPTDRIRDLGFESRTFIPTKHRLKKEPVDWCLDNIIGPEKVQFDFQSNLNLFNKAEEFAKIREQDTVPYEDRLVGHNRRPSRFDTGRQSPFPPPPRNLKNTENVLGATPGGCRREPSTGGWHLMRTDEGLFCPMVDRDILLQVERLAMSETGPNEDQLIENAGRSVALMALKALGGERRLRHDNPTPPPIVIILSGNNKTGAYGICASRHLANRGCQVKLLIVGNSRNLLKTVYEQQRYAACSDVELVSETRGTPIIDSLMYADLPDAITCPVDLIVDSLLGYEHALAALPDSADRILTADLIDWANSNNAPVISLGAPSGLMGDSALSGFSPTSDYVRPKWTLSLGAPTTALSNRASVGEVYLGDIGIPTPLWKRMGIRWQCPYGAGFLVRLDHF
ncbi:enhancer of mRNA decapping [Massospora cicadina]|nr:enhancer of mRNA decapping [Massospora cicadina]